MSQKALQSAVRQVKEEMGIEIGPGKRVPSEMKDEFESKVQEILQASLLHADVK